MDWEPTSGTLWTVVNERDELGDQLVPTTSPALTRETFMVGHGATGETCPMLGVAYEGDPTLLVQSKKPDYALGAHTASLGLAFYTSDLMPDFKSGAVVGQHGSWNRSVPSGYKVIFVPFENGQPAGQPIDVLTGFLDEAGRARGRPAGVAVDDAGAILVADDVGNTIWRVSPTR